MKLDKESFTYWKNDEITKEFFGMLEESLAREKESVSNASLIMEPNSGKVLARILGHIDVLETLLTIEVEDIDGDVDNENT